MALDRKSDPGRIKTESADVQRDLAAKGGPAVGLGDAQNRKVSYPVDADLQTQSASQEKQDSTKPASNRDSGDNSTGRSTH